MNKVVTKCPYCNIRHYVSVIEKLSVTKFKSNIIKYTMIEYKCDTLNRKFENESSRTKSFNNLKTAISKL